MKSWFSIRAAASGAEILIYDEIGLYGVRARDFVQALGDVGKVDRLVLRINSPGGDVFDAMAIYNALRRHSASVEVHVDGLAASAASLVAMAGDRILMPDNAMMMIHDPYGGVIGAAEDMRTFAEALDRIGAAMVGIYADRTGIDAQRIGEMMAAETWLSAEEARELGFADDVLPAIKIAARHDVRRYDHPPQALVEVDGTESENGRKEDDMDTDVREAGAASHVASGDGDAAGGRVVEIEAYQRGRQDALAYVNEITDLCAIAGRQDLARGMIERGVSAADARRILLEVKAESAGAAPISAHIVPTAGTQQPAARPVAASMARLLGKEVK